MPSMLGVLDMFVLARSIYVYSYARAAHILIRHCIRSVHLCVIPMHLFVHMCVDAFFLHCSKFYYRIVSFEVWSAESLSNTQAYLEEVRNWMLYWIRESMIPTSLLPLGAQGLSGYHSNHLYFRLASCSTYPGYPFKFLF